MVLKEFVVFLEWVCWSFRMGFLNNCGRGIDLYRYVSGRICVLCRFFCWDSGDEFPFGRLYNAGTYLRYYFVLLLEIVKGDESMGVSVSRRSRYKASR